MALSLGFFSTYSVYEQECFAGNRVEGSQLGWWCAHDTGVAAEGRGDRMYERFTRPDGGRFSAEFVRAR